MKFLASAFIVAIAAITAAQSDTKITYTTKAKPLAQVLQDLSQQSKTTLQCANALEKEPLILRLNEVPLPEAMNKIADVFGATWVKKDGTFVLDRPVLQAQQDQESGFRQRVAVIKNSIDDLVKRADGEKPLDQKGAEEFVKAMSQVSANHDYENPNRQAAYFKLEINLPATRLAMHVLRSIGPVALASLGQNERVVYSTNPTPMQKGFALDPDDYAEFLRTKALIEQTAKKLGAPGDALPFLGDVDKDMSPGIAKIYLNRSKEGPDRVRMRFIIISKSGTHAFLQYNGVFGADFRNYFESRIERNTQSNLIKSQGYDLDPATQEISTRTQFKPGHLRPLDPKVVDALVNTTQNDPLSFATSDTVLKYADLRDENAICLATDDVEPEAYQATSNGKTTWNSFLQNVAPLNQMSIEEGNGWITAKPFDPVWAQETRVPRQQLEEILKTSLQQKRMSIDQAVTLRCSVPRSASISLASTIAWTLVGGNSGPLGSDVDMLFFLGALTPGQREALKQGPLVTTYGELTNEEKAIASSSVYNGEGRLFGGSMEYESPSQSSTGAPAPPVVEEVTEALPNGLPDNLQIKLSDVITPMVYRETDNTYGQSDLAPAGDFIAAMVVMIAEEKNPDLAHKNIPLARAVTLGQQDLITLQVFANSEQYVQSVILNNYCLNGAMVRPSELLQQIPIEMQRKILAQIDEYIKDRRQQIASGEDSGTAVPPP